MSRSRSRTGSLGVAAASEDGTNRRQRSFKRRSSWATDMSAFAIKPGLLTKQIEVEAKQSTEDVPLDASSTGNLGGGGATLPASNQLMERFELIAKAQTERIDRLEKAHAHRFDRLEQSVTSIARALSVAPDVSPRAPESEPAVLSSVQP